METNLVWQHAAVNNGKPIIVHDQAALKKAQATRECYDGIIYVLRKKHWKSNKDVVPGELLDLVETWRLFYNRVMGL